MVDMSHEPEDEGHHQSSLKNSSAKAMKPMILNFSIKGSNFKPHNRIAIVVPR
jgi:hypothetical protein